MTGGAEVPSVTFARRWGRSNAARSTGTQHPARSTRHAALNAAPSTSARSTERRTQHPALSTSGGFFSPLFLPRPLEYLLILV
jgi:hypothetical protein